MLLDNKRGRETRTSEKGKAMGYEIAKTATVDFKNEVIRVTSTCSNDDGGYHTWGTEGGCPRWLDATFDECLKELASICFEGILQFLPSCESKAHEAYLKTCDEMGGDWHYADEKYGMGTPEYEAFEEEWREKFISFLRDGERDKRKFVMLRHGRTITLRTRLDKWHSLTYTGRYTNSPKSVSWIRQRVIANEYPEFEAIPADELEDYREAQRIKEEEEQRRLMEKYGAMGAA